MHYIKTYKYLRWSMWGHIQRISYGIHFKLTSCCLIQGMDMDIYLASFYAFKNNAFHTKQNKWSMLHV